MRKSLVKPSIVEGVELYATPLGNGMSQVGLARFVGVDEKSIRDLLNNIYQGNVPELINYADTPLYLPVAGFKNAKIVRSDVCAEICSYYVYEKNNEVARFSIKKFASIGIDSWIKQEVGEVNNARALAPDVTELVQQTIRLNQELLQQKDMTIRLQQAVIENQKFLETSTKNAPGLKKMMIATQKQQQQPTLGTRDNGKPVRLSLLEWLAHTGHDLEEIDQTLYRQFRLKVGETYKSLRESKPAKEWRVSPLKADGTGGNSIQPYVYEGSDFPLLETVWNQTVDEYNNALLEAELSGEQDTDDIFN